MLETGPLSALLGVLVLSLKLDLSTAVMSKLLKWAELPARDDIYLDQGTTEWGNHDLYPIVPKERFVKLSFLFMDIQRGPALKT